MATLIEVATGAKNYPLDAPDLIPSALATDPDLW